MHSIYMIRAQGGCAGSFIGQILVPFRTLRTRIWGWLEVG